MNIDIIYRHHHRWSNNRFFGEPVTNWPEHWTNGGTGVTKSSPPETEKMAATVALLNDPAVFMIGSELHSTRQPLDLSDFWKLYREQHQEPLPKIL